MFTDQADQMLYTFDSVAPATARGALAANSASQTISLLPVTLNPVSFQNALTVTWSGAVVTFDNSVASHLQRGKGQPALGSGGVAADDNCDRWQLSIYIDTYF